MIIFSTIRKTAVLVTSHKYVQLTKNIFKIRNVIIN